MVDSGEPACTRDGLRGSAGIFWPTALCHVPPAYHLALWSHGHVLPSSPFYGRHLSQVVTNLFLLNTAARPAARGHGAHAPTGFLARFHRPFGAVPRPPQGWEHWQSV